MDPLSIVIIGFGNMGRALATGWREALPDAVLMAVDPTAEAVDGVLVHRCLADVPVGIQPDAVVLAVKPQQMDVVLDEMAGCGWLRQALVLSIAAGKRLDVLQARLGQSQPMVRAMPNTPALVRHGVTGMVASTAVTVEHRALAEKLMQAVGQVVWLHDEGLMDAWTALAGSGPAYVFALIEAMQAAGVAAGLPEDVAMLGARETVFGAAELARASLDGVDVLRQRVTSPGGTTAAALDVLLAEEGGLTELMKRAVAAAAKRGKALG